ncbi:Bifunctional protein aas [Parabacteroides distasonis]|jgi:long-chain acyl-CoA synthetase|nr:Bifunctional protein aas [Parabacteroides distasonis]
MGLNIITDRGERFSAAELKGLTDEFGRHLPQRSLVFLFCENVIGSLIGYLGCLENRSVPVMLDATKDFDMLKHLLEVYKPNYVWMPLRIKSEKLISEPVYERFSYGLFEYCRDHVNLNDDLALLLTTSGSTGSPKLVRLSNENIKSNAESIAEYLDITSEERPITSLPMYYSYGLSVINSHLLKDATLLLTDKVVIQKEFWAFAKEQAATSIAGVPYTYEMLRRLRIFHMDLPALRTMTQAGGKLSSTLVKEFVEWAQASGRRFIVMYGQTEATARMSYTPCEKALEKYASIGIAIPGGAFSIIDAEGNEITSTDTDGELVYKGPNVSMGYAECIADLAKGDENKGELHTGDVARFDVDGYFYITGRLKRFVKIWGNRCNLDAMEQLVKAGVTTECACAGVDDLVTIFVTQEGLEQDIKSFLSSKMGLNVRAFVVKVIDEIPKNASGKTQYAELQNML